MACQHALCCLGGFSNHASSVIRHAVSVCDGSSSCLLTHVSVFTLQLQLLTLALPRGPAGLPEPDAGAVLALACHVVMVQAGFKVGVEGVRRHG